MINLLDNEKLITIRRRHWFVVVAEGFFVLLVGIVPFIALFALSLYSTGITFLRDYWVYLIFFGTSWFMFSWMLFYVVWTNYYLDVVLVTNKRLIDMEQHTLFFRDVAELRMENVQDIKVEVMGIIPELLKMGNLHIQSAGQSKEVELINIADPYGLKDIISKCHDEILREMSATAQRV